MNVLWLIALFAGVAIASATDYGNSTSSSTGVDSVASAEENEPKLDTATANVAPDIGEKVGSFNVDDIENRGPKEEKEEEEEKKKKEEEKKAGKHGVPAEQGDAPGGPEKEGDEGCDDVKNEAPAGEGEDHEKLKTEGHKKPEEK